MSYRLADVVPVLHCTLAVAIPMRLVVVERIGPVPDPRIVAGSEALNRPAVIDLKLTQESHPLNAGPDVFVPFPNDRGNPFGPALIPVGPRPGCGNKKNIVMAKMDDVSRFFRNLLGLAPIKEFVPLARQAEHADHRMMAAHTRLDEDNNFHILPFMPGPVQGDGIPPPLPGSEAVSRPLFSPRSTRREALNRDCHVAPLPPQYILTLFSFSSIFFFLPITAFQSPTSVLASRFKNFADGSLIRLNSAIIECGFTVTAHTLSSAASARPSSPSRPGKAARSRL